MGAGSIFFFGGGVVEIPGGGSKKRQSPDFRSPEVDISAITTYRHDLLNPLKKASVSQCPLERVTGQKNIKHSYIFDLWSHVIAKGGNNREEIVGS